MEEKDFDEQKPVVKTWEGEESIFEPTEEKIELLAEEDEVDELVQEEDDNVEIEEIPSINELFPEEGEQAQAPHYEFDWTGNQKSGKTAYSDEQHKEMESFYENSFREITDNEIIKGKVEAITDSDVILDIGFKSDGLVSLSEFRDMPQLATGDEVEVYVVSKENESGQLVLSRKNAKLMRAWDRIVLAFKSGEIVTGQIISKTKGGLIAEVFGMETFLPGSQIDVKPVTDYDGFVGKLMEFKVVKINETIKNAVVSHKALIESDMEAQRSEIISRLEKGSILEGVIKNITDFGAFIDLGGVDGLLYITDISWGRIKHPNEVLSLDQKLNVVVLDFDDNKKRISLGLKQLQPHPWDSVSDDIKVGDTVKGKIVNIEDYGSFLELNPGVEGLIHVSEVSWSNQPINSREYFKLGDIHEAKVMTIDKDDRKMSLSIKQLSEDPWKDIAKSFPVGSKHEGIVRNITPYGVFVELKDGIGGMVHISDLSWTKRFNHPSEFTKVGTPMSVIVLEIDEEARRLSLGHKQIEEDPWETFKDIFPINSMHEGTIISKDDRGAVISLPYGLEAFCPNRFLKKEDNTTAALDESLSFMIVEFNRDEKRIIVSHSHLVKKQQDANAAEVDAKAKKPVKKTRDTMTNIPGQVEKTTLGDLDVLSQLKAKMEDTEKKTKKTDN